MIYPTNVERNLSADFSRAFWDKVEISTSSSEQVLARYDDSEVYLKGDTYEYRGVIKNVASELGKRACWDRMEVTWKVTINVLKKLVKVHHGIFAKSVADSGIYAMYNGSRLEI